MKHTEFVRTVIERELFRQAEERGYPVLWVPEKVRVFDGCQYIKVSGEINLDDLAKRLSGEAVPAEETRCPNCGHEFHTDWQTG